MRPAVDGIGRAFLFSVDLEDVRSMIPDGARHAPRVEANVERYLEVLARHDARCTFFTVGDIARRSPELVRSLVAAGHEVACHGADHVPLARLGPDGFRDDLRRALDDLARAGVDRVSGFRAPVMSLVRETGWAHEILAELGFAYSSSVVPAGTALYGWPEHPADCVRTASGIWEIPVSVFGGRRGVPFLSGVYFRLLPFAIVRARFEHALRSGRPAVGYLHPYDVDTEQERFMHPELGGSRVLNRLMYVGRGGVCARLDRLFARATVMPYRDFVAQRLATGGVVHAA
ncbi:MAG: polysaccharide deacetylase family protein [Myxococcota bacterium]|nr:polysaccharide deacetylase family protein [Myxococcota bacterium]